MSKDLDHLGDILMATTCLHEVETAQEEALELYRALALEAESLAPRTDEALDRYKRLLKRIGQPEETIQARLAELRQGLPPVAPAPLCTPPPD